MEKQPNLENFEENRNVYPEICLVIEKNCTYISQEPYQNEPGGMLRKSEGGALTLSNDYFYKCHGSYGGAISIDSKSNEEWPLELTMNDVYFDQCVASELGGALNLQDGKATITNCVFKYNTSKKKNTVYSGGAIFADYASAVCTINDSVFYGNTSASGTGGAISINNADFTITDCSFLQTSDSLFAIDENAKLTFAGTNFFGASVQKSKGSIESADGARFVFINYEPISFICDLGVDNTIELNNSAPVALDTVQPTHLVINAGTGTSKVGENKDLVTASWLSEDLVITCDGVTDTIVNLDSLTLAGNSLSADITFLGRVTAKNAYIEDETARIVQFIDGNYSENFGSVTAGGAKNIIGSGIDKTSLQGTLFADGNALSINALTYSGRIYGGGDVSASTALSASDVSLEGVSAVNGMRINGGSRITASGAQVSSEGTSLVIGLSEATGGKAGSIFGGAAITGTAVIYNAGTIETTVNSGKFGKIVGNGSSGNYDGTINQDASTLTINGGTFDGRVYAGGYSMAAAAEGSRSTAEVLGDVALNINGGAFNAKVYGGCAADYDYLSAHNTAVHGDVTVKVNCADNVISFGDALFAGSQAGGKIYGNTRLIFTGNAANLDFSQSGYGRFYGGSQNEFDYDDPDESSKFVSGTRTLEFNDFQGNLNARFWNLDEVTFSGSQVVLTRHSDLHLVDTWNFDVSDGLTDLTWNHNSTINSFNGDTINLYGWDGVSTEVFMQGVPAAIRDFDKATVKVYDGAGTLITSGYSVTQNGNKLQIAAA